jgi:hypothetical protein
MLEVGRVSLKRIAQHFPVSAGVSRYNAAELESYGFKSRVYCRLSLIRIAGILNLRGMC